MNIRTSMFRLVSLLILIPFLLFSFLISCIYADKLQTVITESLQAVANAQIAQMTSFCQQQMNNLILLGDMDVSQAALRGELDRGTLEYLDNMLYSRVQHTSYLKSSALVDMNYRVVACSEDKYDALAHSGIAALISDMGSEPFYISDVVDDPLKNGEKSVVGISVIQDGAVTLGYALVEIDLSFYDDIRRQTELWQNSTFYLLDGQQKIISAGTTMENRSSFVTTDVERDDYNKKYRSIDFDANPTGSFTYRVSGQNYITYYSNVQYTNWEFLLTVNLDNYMAPHIIYGVLAGLLVLLCLVLALCIGAFTSRRILMPIERISGTLLDIQNKQDYSLRIRAKRRDELGSLSERINELLSFIETENLYKAKQQRKLQQKAERDALTRVLNKERTHHFLQEAIERHRAEKTAMAVLFIDVDDFKAFNTAYGHDVGDRVLLFLTSLLAQETNGTVGRVGGDEFLVIMENPEHLRELDTCLKQINELAHTDFVLPETNQSLPISCCIGAVRIDFAVAGSDATAASLTKLADEAMYQVKNHGKHGYAIQDYDVL